MALHLKNRHWQIVQQILSKYPYQFYAYGSRVKGTTHRTSDLDLCYQENIPDSLVFEIKDEFTESNLPFIVELVNWKHMRPAFQQAIQKDLTLISNPSYNLNQPNIIPRTRSKKK